MEYKKLLLTSTVLAGALGVASMADATNAHADTVDTNNNVVSTNSNSTNQDNVIFVKNTKATDPNGNPMDPGFEGGMDSNFGQGEPNKEPLDPNFGQGEPNKEPLDPNFGQGEPNKEPLDPNFGQGEPEKEPLDPNFGQTPSNPGTSDKDENIDPDFGVDSKPVVDPDFGQGEPNKEPLDPNFGQGEPEKPVLDPWFGQGEPNKPNKPNKPEIIGPTTPGADTGIDDNFLIDQDKDQDNSNDTTNPGTSEIKDTVVAPVIDGAFDQVKSDKTPNYTNLTNENADAKEVVAVETKDEESLPQTGAEDAAAVSAAGVALIAASSLMGYSVFSKKRKNS